MTTQGGESKPLVLVVDDDPRNHPIRHKQLERESLDVIVAQSAPQAIRELRNAPCLDVVLTDLHLDTSVPGDASGYQVAIEARDRFGAIPVFAYSSYFAERPPTAEELALFSDGLVKHVYTKGQMKNMLDQIKEAAFEHRGRRRNRATEEHRELSSVHSLETIGPAETVRRLLPHADDKDAIEASLRAAGYRLELVHSSAFHALASPLLVWMKTTEEGAEAEVYGQPSLYAHGENPDDAVARLIELMRLFAEDYAATDAPTVGPAADLRTFLERTIDRGAS